MCSEAPDMSGANAAAVKQADLSQEELDWYKQLYADTAPQRADATARQNAVSDAQLGLMHQQQTLTDEANQRYKDTFQPLEDKMASDALAYDTPERREQAAGEAMNDVDTQTSLARDMTVRDLADRGVDASSGNAAMALSRIGLASGAGRAASANAARKQVETVGAAKLADAANLGRGIATTQATTAGLALNAGNSSAGNAGQALSTATSGAGLMQAGYQGAQQGLQGAANTYMNIGKTEAGIGEGKDSATAGLAGAAMTAAAIF